ncbi:MAG: hypothetical protein LBC42_03660 [Puniceicoccales bacterium]|nr:hypothetical protein [Puniceicoccales bacterium]
MIEQEGEVSFREGVNVVYRATDNTVHVQKGSRITCTALLLAFSTLPHPPRNFRVYGVIDAADGTVIEILKKEGLFTQTITLIKEGLSKVWAAAFFTETFKIFYALFMHGDFLLPTLIDQAMPWLLLGSGCLFLILFLQSVTNFVGAPQERQWIHEAA